MAMVAFTFRASVHVWSVKLYLPASLSARGTTWDFIWPSPAEARIYLVVSCQEQRLHKNGGAGKRKHGESPAPAVFTWVPKIFSVSAGSLLKGCFRAITEDGEETTTFCSYSAMLYPQTVPAGLLSCAF